MWNEKTNKIAELRTAIVGLKAVNENLRSLIARANNVLGIFHNYTTDPLYRLEIYLDDLELAAKEKAEREKIEKIVLNLLARQKGKK